MTLGTRGLALFPTFRSMQVRFQPTAPDLTQNLHSFSALRRFSNTFASRFVVQAVVR